VFLIALKNTFTGGWTCNAYTILTCELNRKMLPERRCTPGPTPEDDEGF